MNIDKNGYLPWGGGQGTTNRESALFYSFDSGTTEMFSKT